MDGPRLILKKVQRAREIKKGSVKTWTGHGENPA
jgi:hypothetical protein